MINPFNDAKLGELLSRLWKARHAEQERNAEAAWGDWFSMNWTLFFGPAAWQYLCMLPRDETGTVSMRLGEYTRPGPTMEPVLRRAVAEVDRPREVVDRANFRTVHVMMIFGMAGYADEHMPPMAWRVADTQGFTVLWGDWS